jgi:coproporphyrinogen III oxidase-like Fe-S oxidoreductase
MEGIDLYKLGKEFGTVQRRIIEQQIQKFINNNLMRLNNSLAQLTDEGMLRADGIASELFFV